VADFPIISRRCSLRPRRKYAVSDEVQPNWTTLRLVGADIILPRIALHLLFRRVEIMLEKQAYEALKTVKEAQSNVRVGR
jgi:hypothetical protein